MFGLGAGEILLILLFALIFIGPKKLPELAKGLGKGIREFQKAKDDLFDDTKNLVNETKSDSLPTGVNEAQEDLTHTVSENKTETLAQNETQEVKKES
ncbi:MAG: twin-arginine translocase TatA/TatE family subunit [Deltaproteobacteria bacterium]|jgi:sec-independent protein translocase protein TatA|nr:MAG: twin-arginine translocase TatA/TatE family subunit [Deltaproteobacteria bacterium]